MNGHSYKVRLLAVAKVAKTFGESPHPKLLASQGYREISSSETLGEFRYRSINVFRSKVMPIAAG